MSNSSSNVLRCWLCFNNVASVLRDRACKFSATRRLIDSMGCACDSPEGAWDHFTASYAAATKGAAPDPSSYTLVEGEISTIRRNASGTLFYVFFQTGRRVAPGRLIARHS